VLPLHAPNCISTIMSIMYFLNALKILGLTHSITYGFSSLECLYILYLTLVRPRLEYEMLGTAEWLHNLWPLERYSAP
jgi:hypothetical protein